MWTEAAQQQQRKGHLAADRADVTERASGAALEKEGHECLRATPLVWSRAEKSAHPPHP
jgi:hypothetical protein